MRKTITIIALVVAAITAYFVWQGSQHTSNQVFVPALQFNVAPGTRIESTMLVPNGVPLDANALKDLPIVTDVNQIVGKVAMAHIFANVPIIKQQLVDSDQSIWAQSKTNFFISIPLKDIGLTEVPYTFMHGKIDICETISQAKSLQLFTNGLPTDEYQKMVLHDTFCPVKNIYAIALTDQNLLPWTYVTFDPNAKKYIAGPKATKIGFWLQREEDILSLKRVLADISAGKSLEYVDAFLVLPPTDSTTDYSKDANTVIDLSKQVISPYDFFGIPYLPEELASGSVVIQRTPVPTPSETATPLPGEITPTPEEPVNPFAATPTP